VARLVSVNVGRPKNVPWQGKTVFTGVWKTPVEGAVMVRRLNLDGDGQGDLAGHGGEQRAVLVYQTGSYDHWRSYLGRHDLVPGHFGENFTVSGLGDDEVCIGDRYRIGEAEFEVTQPRVTCFRVGMRLGEPDMPNLLVAHHRPGFYMRVIHEGRVRAGDPIELTRRGNHELSIADVDALLYLPDRDDRKLRQAVDLPALSPGWQQSFRDMLSAQGDSDLATTPPAAMEPAWAGFRPLRVGAIHRESSAITSLALETTDGTPLPSPRPGQYLTVKIPDAGDPAPLRSYSLSGDPNAGTYRISVKREEHGQVSRWLHTHIRTGSTLDAAAPRGDFCLTDDSSPVVLVSAGVGATPVLAMLHALAACGSQRQICWVHTTHNRESHAFATEVTGLIDALPHAQQHIFYTTESSPGAGQRTERLTAESIAALGLPTGAAVYLCGPNAFMEGMRAALTAVPINPCRIHTESFGALAPINPGVVDAPTAKRPHRPLGMPATGPQVTFSRSGLTVNWSPDYRSLLELAEACDVPTRYSCRSGVCHTCVTGVVAGAATYIQPPLDQPPSGTVLICCAAPVDGLVLDL
jgi:ferredoxin-NADP reductase/MOSC domain-containing protein YiiM